ncbi:MAG: TonB-dependent receptor [Candidatus Marinimicrobia bacterium]|nr:TonB-dependent receptor [Candidatus Neomarinimicrobiota bacterium]MBT3630025.1 TonB-dependent receptor [Candidatus Neomarinimicrobiota bacterium]MBT3823429.1 TonB-dependent receptor [Candidatus Neomarinimicrobiota bacterium]MBT4130125.1 TonB-dependent receptor [Candidatus Neomarinimicrobiota bacterium]MBT4295526.1 TonB-dependent receptor [Candidatus Neomarinimicrobiota bacterium]
MIIRIRKINKYTIITLQIILLFMGSDLTYAKSNTNDINGYVSDTQNGETLPYANVSQVGTNRGTTTNSDGYFVLTDVPVGPCSLQVSYMGYENLKFGYFVEPVGLEPLELKLIPKSIGGDEVEVYAERYELIKISQRTSQVTLSPRDLQILPNFGEVDIFRSLQLLPGVSGISDGKAGLYVRGGTPDENMVMYDGMTIYHVDHFFGMFSAFNPEAVKDVQFYKGGFPAKYGGRLSSVVELTGKEGGNETNYAVGLNLLSANVLAQYSFWENKGSWLLSARRSYNDLIETPTYQSIYEFATGDESLAEAAQGKAGGGGMGSGAMQASVVPSFYYFDVNSKLTLKPTTQDKINFSLYSGRDYLDKSQEMAMQGSLRNSESSQFNTRVDENYTDWGNLGASLRYSHQWSSRGFTSLLLSGSEYTSSYSRNLSFGDANVIGTDSSGSTRGLGGFAQDESNTVLDYTFRFDNQWQWTPLHKLDFGILHSDVKTDYAASIRDTIEILAVASKSKTTAAYIQDEWKVTSRLNVTMGLRSTYDRNTLQNYFAPRFNFDWHFGRFLTLKGAWGKYYQFINSIENEDVLQGSKNFWLSADENIKPSESSHSILGFALENKGYLFDVEGYYKESENLVEFNRRFQDQADYLNYFYFGGGIARGIDFLLQKKQGAFNGWIGYTLGSVEYTFPNLNEGIAFPATHDRTHELKLVNNYSRGAWSLSSTYIFATGRAYTAPESQYFLEMLDGSIFSYIHVGDKNAYRLPDSHQWNISVSRKFESQGWDWDAGLSIYNVLNYPNVVYRDYDLDTNPIVITDVNTLGFTPTLYIKANLK